MPAAVVPQLPPGQLCDVALVVPLLPTVVDDPLCVPALADVLPAMLPAVFSVAGVLEVAVLDAPVAAALGELSA